MYLIKNATVHIGNGTVLQQSDVLVEGKVIKEVGKNLSAEGAEVIDASGCEVFPGFIDPVSSIGAMGIPGRYLDNNEATNPITPCLLYTSPSPRDGLLSRMPSSA